MKNVLHRLANFIIPHTCLQCRTHASSYGLCYDCFNNITFISDAKCSQCGCIIINRKRGKFCATCLTKRLPYIHRSAVVYDQYSKPLILLFKHADTLAISPFMSKMMLNSIRDFKHEIDIIIPVPLYRTRLLKRKYNQSAILAQSIAKTWNIPMCINTLLRIRKTESQEGKNFKSRHDNVKNAFTIHTKASLKGKNILLVDDVYTSGATIKACTKVLKKAGVKKVISVSYARIQRT